MPHARLLHRRPSEVRHDGALPDAQPASADLHARRQGAVVLRVVSCARALTNRARAAARTRSRATSRCSPARGADQLAGEASPQYLRSEHAAREIARAAPGRADRRDPARAGQLPALAAPAARRHAHRGRARLRARRSRSRTPGAGASTCPGDSVSPQSLLYSDHVRYAEQLRRLHDAFPPEQVLVLIYDDFRRDNEAVLRQVLRVPRRRPATSRSSRSRPSRWRPCARCACTSCAARSASRAEPGQPRPPGASGRRARRRARSAATRSPRPSAASPTARQRPADDELMLELRRRFQARGAGR